MAAALLTAAVAIPHAQDAITVDLQTRALAPGELLVFTIAAAPTVEELRVSVLGRTVPVFAIAEGRYQALAGIDLEQKPGRFTATVSGTERGQPVRAARPFVIAAKTFPTRNLTVLPDYVNPPPDVMGRINRDSELLRETYAKSAATRQWAEPFVRPVTQAANSVFGSRSVYNGQPRSPHAGADFLSPAGTPIHAPNAGRVAVARDLYFTGNTVIIDHGLGVFSVLAHLSKIDVQEGDQITAGQTVGLVGATGRVTGPHLHWGVLVNGARVDPLSVLALLGRK